MRGRGTGTHCIQSSSWQLKLSVVPVGPRAGVGVGVGAGVGVGVGLPVNIPKGPKAGRFKDKDRVEASSSGGLDYGGEGGSTSRSDSGSPVKVERTTEKARSEKSEKSGKKDKKKEHDEEYSDENSRDRDRDREKEREKSKEKPKEGRVKKSSRKKEEEDGRKEKRKRDDGTINASLGPGGWESASDDERRSR